MFTLWSSGLEAEAFCPSHEPAGRSRQEQIRIRHKYRLREEVRHFTIQTRDPHASYL
jgi:hypothetical protein